MSAMQNPISSEANKMQRLARLKKFDELEAALMAGIESDTLSLTDLCAVLDVVAEQKDAAKTESLTWLAISLRSERNGPAAGIELVRYAAELLPQNETIRNEAADLYRKAAGPTTPQIAVLVEMTLGRKNTPMALAVQQLERLIQLVGAVYVLDLNVNAPGRVVRLDEQKKELVVVLSGTERRYDAVGALKLERIADDDFRALAVFEKDRMSNLAKDNPEELVRLALKTFGPALHFRDLKAHLTQVIVSSAWSKWWTAAKAPLHRSALIEMTGGTQPTLTLRAKPLAFGERMLREFEEIESPEEKIVFVFNYLSTHAGETSPDEVLLSTFARQMLIVAKDSNDGLKLAARAVLERMTAQYPSLADVPAPAPEPPTDPANLLTNVANDDVAKLIVGYLRRGGAENWYDVLTSVLPGASAVVAEWIAGELTAGGGVRESLTRAIESILHWPDRYARAMVWIYKNVAGGKAPDYLAGADRPTVLTGLLTAAQALKRKPPMTDVEQQRRTLTQIKNALTNDDFAFVRDVLKNAGHDYAGYLRDTVPRNPGLGDALSSDIVKIIRETHPSLFSKALPPWEEDAVYTTQQALDRKNEEFNKLCNVDIAHNAKTIGEAAERGDLRENAEFTAALEERDRLTERASRMRADLKKAKVIYHSMADTDHVTVGSAVTARNLATGQVERFTFLGPWDADPQRNILSYSSPLAQSFMGKKVGETVTHTTSEGPVQWRVEEIAPGL